jgi:hypothetical protein
VAAIAGRPIIQVEDARWAKALLLPLSIITSWQMKRGRVSPTMLASLAAVVNVKDFA